MNKKALSGLKVLDLTRLYAGPYCTMLLGDLGADVVKVEVPNGDPIREQGPPFHKGHGLSFLAVNRNKRSIVIDLKTVEGKELASKLCREADVIVENFRPGVMDRLGLGYEEIKKDNPGVVFASVSGMGADGPMKDKGAFDLTAQAVGGYMSITGERGGAPVKLGTSAFDLVAGMNATIGILAALWSRASTGQGQQIETSLLEGQIGFLVEAGLEYLVAGTVRDKWGSQHANLVPYKAFEAADGWIVIGAGMQRLYLKFMDVIGRPDLAEDPRFRTERDRVKHREEMYEILDEIVKTHHAEELEKALDSEGVPCAVVNTMDRVFTNAQVLHRNMVQSVEHEDYGKISVIGPSVKYGGFDVAQGWTAPPVLDEHHEAVVRDWLGQ